MIQFGDKVHKFLFILLIPFFAWGNSSNYVAIKIDNLDYTRPENNKGKAGTLKFPNVKLVWDELKLSLNDTSSFMDTTIKTHPRYLKFNTESVKISVPLSQDTKFFDIASAKLSNANIDINHAYFNFDGEHFEMSNGVSNLVLDKFNIYCDGPESVDMTSIDGLIHGCMTHFILNGQNEGDLAGAEIEYVDTIEKENDLYLKSTLKDFRLENHLLKLDLISGLVKVSGFEVDIGKAKFSCKKDPTLVSLNVDQLKNGCINDIQVEAPDILVKNIEAESNYHVTLEQLITKEEQVETTLNNVTLQDDKGSTILENIQINCFREDNSEFYDLHKTLAGCFHDSKVSIDSILSVTERENFSFLQKYIFLRKAKSVTKKFAKNLKARFENNKLYFSMSIKPGIFPRFNLNFEADISHDPEDRTITLKITKIKKIKFVTVNKALMYIAGFFIGDAENITIKGRKITISL